MTYQKKSNIGPDVSFIVMPILIGGEKTYRITSTLFFQIKDAKTVKFAFGANFSIFRINIS